MKPDLVIKSISLTDDRECRGCYYSIDADTDCSKEGSCLLPVDRVELTSDIYVVSVKTLLKKL